MKNNRKTKGAQLVLTTKCKALMSIACGPVPKVNGRHVGIGRCAYVLWERRASEGKEQWIDTVDFRGLLLCLPSSVSGLIHPFQHPSINSIGLSSIPMLLNLSKCHHVVSPLILATNHAYMYLFVSIFLSSTERKRWAATFQSSKSRVQPEVARSLSSTGLEQDSQFMSYCPTESTV